MTIALTDSTTPHDAFGIAKDSRGFTLLVMLVTIIMLSILGAVALESLTPSLESAHRVEAEREMRAIADAIAGSYATGGAIHGGDFGYIGDVGALPASLSDLVSNPAGYGTWRGPYLQEDFTEGSGEALQDPWGSPYNYSTGVTITSTGSGATLSQKVAALNSDLINCGFSGLVSGANGASPGAASADLIVVAVYPNGTGGYTRDTTSVAPSGSYAFMSGIPIGVHSVFAYDTAALDSAETFIRILPRSNSSNSVAGSLRFAAVSY